MDIVFRCAGAVLISTVVVTVLNRQNKDMATVLQMAVCAMLLLTAVNCLSPVLDFLSELEELGGFEPGLVEVLIKITGIALITEIASLICADAGNASLGKGLQMVAAAVILYLAIPAFTSLLKLLRDLLEVT